MKKTPKAAPAGRAGPARAGGPPRPGAAAAPPLRRGGPRPGADPSATRTAVFAAAADAFSRRGFDGVAVDDIARAAGVNKAMIYYHFDDKLALYRDIVCDMLRAAGATVTAIADAGRPRDKIARVHRRVRRARRRAALLSDADDARDRRRRAASRCRTRWRSCDRCLSPSAASSPRASERACSGRVHPVLAYMTILGPLMLNAARERVGARPGRGQLPMFVYVPHADLTRHMQHVALRMLQKD